MPGAAGDAATSETQVPAGQVRAQLTRILSSDGFVTSQRLCRFLRFIVERTLENDVNRLKEFVVAMEVFDRNEDYDPNIDSIVRVEARRLRTKLKAFYEGPGSRDPVLIGLRPGSYVPVFRLLAQQEHTAAPEPLAAAVEYTTIAVLPFVNMSPEPDQDFFCDGISEEIINSLASIENVAVVSRTSSFQFKGKAVDIREVGDKLGAQLIVEGSVRKAGNQLRITAQAIDAVKGYHLWSETYRRELQDVFAVQEEISTAIATMVRAKLPLRALRTAAAYQPSLEAYTGYFRALQLVHQQNIPGLRSALTEFHELTRLYPEYADPYAGIATTHAVLALFGVVSGRQVFPELRRNAEQAVRLNPDSVDGWTVMAGISAHWEFDWAEAERRFRKAIGLQPSNHTPHSWFGMVLTMLGRFDEAESELSLAIRLNPLFPSGHARRGFLSYLRGNDALAISQLNESLRLEPDFADARFILGLVHMRREDPAAVVEILSNGMEQMPIAIHMGLLAGAYHRLGKTAQCQALLSRLDRMAADHYVTPMARVAACIGMRDLNGAFDALSASIDDRAIFADLLNVDPFIDPLRADPRFHRLVASMNLVSSRAASPSPSGRRR